MSVVNHSNKPSYSEISRWLGTSLPTARRLVICNLIDWDIYEKHKHDFNFGRQYGDQLVWSRRRRSDDIANVIVALANPTAFDLSDYEIKILELYYIESLPLKKIADIIGKKPPTINFVRYSAIKKINDALKKMLPCMTKDQYLYGEVSCNS